MKSRETKEKKLQTTESGISASKVWVNPNCTFKGPRSGHSANSGMLPAPTAARFLELADIALASDPLPPARKKKLIA